MYDREEVLGVLSHELGHWKKHHFHLSVLIDVLRGILDVLIIMLCFSLANLDEVYSLTNTSEKPVMIVFIAFHRVFFLPLFGILANLEKVISRQMEYVADDYAKNLGHSDGLIKCLIRIHLDNKSYPFEDRLFFNWHSTHPTLLERIRSLKTD